MKFLGKVNGTVVGSHECEDGLYCLNQSELALSGGELGEVEFIIESESYHYLDDEELELTIMYRQGKFDGNKFGDKSIKPEIKVIRTVYKLSDGP